MASSKPEFIVVPGAWHGPESFGPTITILEQAGYTVHGVELPSAGASPPLQDFSPDVEKIRLQLNHVLSSGKDVVLVYHSYGGIPGSEALSDYVQSLESGQAKKEGTGKVLRLVYCTAFVLPEGQSLSSALGGQLAPWVEIKDGNLTTTTPAEVFYNDLPEDVQKKYIALLKVQSHQSFLSPLTVAPWKVIPSTYVLCENDQAIPLPGQEGMLAGARALAPDSFDVVERCDAGHFPSISQPEWLAEKLIKAAST